LSWSIANRVSFALNLTGPSLPVDSACSSALTAVHLACESLKSGECGAALVGAVNLFLHPFKYILNSSQRMLSAAGRCRTFSAEADGFVPAEGVGAFLLVPLETALRNGDHIYALIKGTAINHGGRTNGFTVPNLEAQAAVIAKAMTAAGIHPRTITYLEAHGTGTALGDPIEIDGLTKAFEKHTTDKGYCAVGSVKSNIGHAEAAAGAASLTKVILQFRHRWIAPTLYADHPNPDIDFPSTPFFLRSEGGPWPRPVVREKGEAVEYPRRAGISSFGAGGVNAHIIVEEFSETRAQNALPEPGETLIVLSALSREQLRTSARHLAEFIETGKREKGRAGNINLADAAYTLQVGRVSLRERVALIVSGPGELAQQLSAFAADESVPSGVWTGRADAPQDASEPRVLLQALQNYDLPLLAQAWIAGAVIPWKQLYPNLSSRRRLSLPTSPFRARRYWIDDLVPAAGRGEKTTAADPAGQDQTTVARPAPLDQLELVEGFCEKITTRRSPSRAVHSLPGADNSHTDGLETVFPIVPAGMEFSLTGKMVEVGHGKTEFTMNVSIDACAYLKAHRLFGRAVLSGPTQLAMLFEAAYRMLSTARIEIRHMSFIQPIVVAESERLALVLEVNRAPGSPYNFVFRSRSRDSAGGDWTIHSSGTLSDNRDAPALAIDPAEWKSPGTREKSIAGFYRRLEGMGYRFEPSFKHLTHLAANETIAVASITGASEEDEYSTPLHRDITIMDPGIIDSCIQTLLPVLPERVTREKPHSIYVPVFVSGFSLQRPLTGELECRAKRIEWDDKKETLLGSLLLQGTTGDLIGKIEKFRLKRVDSERLLKI
jgi:acyl transferase domain-containing protein